MTRVFLCTFIYSILHENTVNNARISYKLSYQIVAVDAPYDSSLVRSRYLKVNLIKIISESFVYLDSDTLILKLLDSIWDDRVDIAASVDLTPKDAKNNTYSPAMEEAYKIMGWQFPPKRYLNSGVILVNDTQNSRQLGNELATSWAEQYKKTGKVNDQYVFNHSINSMDIKVKLLPIYYNAQFIMIRLWLKMPLLCTFIQANLILETIPYCTY